MTVPARWADVEMPWRAQRWSAAVRSGEIADIAFDGRQILRGVRAVVRDEDWGTLDWAEVEPERTRTGLRIPLRTTRPGAGLVGSLTVDADGERLAIELELTAVDGCATNRTGLTVLHPPRVTGSALTVRHPDGSTTRTAFPRDPAPHQPAKDIAGLAWVDDGVHVDLAVSGDVFEMEDQRNWTDASYKTYSRPLSEPFPYRLATGERVLQRAVVTARLAWATAEPARSGRRPGEIVLREDGLYPQIGLTASQAPEPLPSALEVRADLLLVDLDLRSRVWRAALDRAARAALPLDVRVVASADDDLVALAVALGGREVVRVAAFDPVSHVSDAALVRRLRDALDAAGVVAEVVGGSRAHYTELNRSRARIAADLDGIAVASTPLFHDRSTAQLVEAVAMQRLVARATLALAAGRPVHVGPVALRPPFNPVATTAQRLPDRDDLADGYGAEMTGAADPRQRSPELAAWTVASAAAFARDGVASIVLFEDAGPRGVAAADGEAWPAAAAVAALAGAPVGARLLSGSDIDGLVWAIGRRTATTDTVLVSNLDRTPRRVVLRIGSGRPTAIEVAAGDWSRVELPR